MTSVWYHPELDELWLLNKETGMLFRSYFGESLVRFLHIKTNDWIYIGEFE